MKLFQPDIFDTPSIAYNTAVRKLVELDTASAGDALREYQGYSPDENLDLEYAFKEFLEDWAVRDIMESDPETGMNLWDEWLKNQKNGICLNERQKGLIRKVRKAYFQRLSRTFLEQWKQMPDGCFITGGRAIKCLMEGGLWNQAMKMAGQIIHRSDKPAKVLGYIGDCAFNIKMKNAAKDSYLQACLLAPSQMDIQGICDPEVRELLTDPGYVCDEHDIPPGPWCENIEWAGATGIITGIFSIIMKKALHDVVNLEDIFSSNEDCRSSGPMPGSNAEVCHAVHGKKREKGPAFGAGLILSFQSQSDEDTVKGKKYSDITEIRRTTRRMAPELFSMALARFETGNRP